MHQERSGYLQSPKKRIYESLHASSRNITSASTKPFSGCSNAPGKRPTVSNPRLAHNFTARSFVLTTKLNCIARNPRSFALSNECKHIARAIPFPCAAAEVTYPQFATCAPPPCWFAFKKYVPSTSPFSSQTNVSFSGENQ